MAAVSFPEAGTEFGECAEPCDHTDCATTRLYKAALCTWCHVPIGTRWFYKDPDGGGEWDRLIHAPCLEARIATGSRTVERVTRGLPRISTDRAEKRGS
jgi:hypothetical protein